MMTLSAWTADCPDQSAALLLEQFDGDLATVERHIVDEQLATALRQDDYDSYLHWRRVKSICAGLAAERRLAAAAAAMHTETERQHRSALRAAA